MGEGKDGLAEILHACGSSMPIPPIPPIPPILWPPLAEEVMAAMAADVEVGMAMSIDMEVAMAEEAVDMSIYFAFCNNECLREVKGRRSTMKATTTATRGRYEYLTHGKTAQDLEHSS